jgi:hypothetical protein
MMPGSGGAGSHRQVVPVPTDASSLWTGSCGVSLGLSLYALPLAQRLRLARTPRHPSIARRDESASEASP